MRVTVWAVLSLVLAAGGVLLWLGMGLALGRWTDIGVYTVSIVLLGFGLFGLLASQSPEPQ